MLTQKLDRIEVCNELYDDIVGNTYSPSIPRDYIIFDKHNFVPRVVPALDIKDLCVYYFCIKSLEKYLAINRVEGTYGGYSLNGELRKQEEDELDSSNNIFIISNVSEDVYNPSSWKKAWGDFQTKAHTYSSSSKYEKFILLDVANFYDSIDLTKLEQKIRSSIPKDLSEIVDLLFFFLKFWNKKVNKYGMQNIGLPQDEFGECSRILANFYLQDYDESMSEYCTSQNAKYFRYADDQIIMLTAEGSIYNSIFQASKKLAQERLSLNSGKVKSFISNEEFNSYYAFDIHQLIDKDNFNVAVDKYISRNKQSFRWVPVLKRIVQELKKNKSITLNALNKAHIMTDLLNESFLCDCKSYFLTSIYEILPEEKKPNYLQQLESLARKVPFNIFHYRLLKAKSKKLPINFDNLLKERIKETAFL